MVCRFMVLGDRWSSGSAPITGNGHGICDEVGGGVNPEELAGGEVGAANEVPGGVGHGVVRLT